MSPQLAISSAFATFAMAALCVLSAGGNMNNTSDATFMPVQAELPSLDLPASDYLLP